ncbi:MAG: type II toxin-antitoxin system prevent-host-death family antitoxin, partial [Rickettsia sp.]
HFLNLVDQVKSKHNSFIITKRKLPVAKVVPLD